MTVTYLKGREDDHIVAQKKITAGVEEHIVTLYYYPIQYDERIKNEKIISKRPEWQVEVDLGAFYKRSFSENEVSARLCYELINTNFIASVVVWHEMKRECDKYRQVNIDILEKKIFMGKKK